MPKPSAKLKPLIIKVRKDGSVRVDGKLVDLDAHFTADGDVVDPEALRAELERLAKDGFDA